MTRQHTVCINTVIFNCLITNFIQTRGTRYSHSVLVTRLRKNFLPDNVFDSYDRVFVISEWATSAYRSCLHAVWIPNVQPEDAQAESSSEELLEKDDDPAFWQQPLPTDSRAFMSSIWRGMKEILRGRLG